MEVLEKRAAEFGKLLRKLREENHLSQKQLLERIQDQGHEKGSVASISRWEHGGNIPPLDIVETLEDIFGVREGSLLKLAGYGEAAFYRRAMTAPSELEAHQEKVLKLIEKFKSEVKGLCSAHRLVEPDISKIVEPGTYDICLRDKLGNTVHCKYEKGPNNEVSIHCPAEYEPVFPFVRNHLRDAELWHDYEEWQEIARQFIGKISDRTARGFSRDRSGRIMGEKREVSASDLGIKLNQLAEKVVQKINLRLSEREAIQNKREH